MKFGLIGNPIEHSLSPRMFNDMFRAGKIDASYEAYCLESIDELPGLLAREVDLVGLNVTSPFKQEVMRYVSSLTVDAKCIGAVNTIFIERTPSQNQSAKIELRGGGTVRLIGHNTDSEGVREMLSVFNLALSHSPQVLNDFSVNNTHKPIYVLGSGGASKAVCHALNREGVKYVIVSRSSLDGGIKYSELDSPIHQSAISRGLIIDATPLGMGRFKDEKPDIPYHALTPDSTLVDLVYSPSCTPFLREGLRHGATVRNGASMLVGQARHSWSFWVINLMERQLVSVGDGMRFIDELWPRYPL